MSNRLTNETSPYLLQHMDNPVDWYPWGEEAFLLAKKEDKPVFLSIGYSSCHWCHVMAHESFEDAEVAEVLNKYFICIKLDREERPDVDETFMTATQLATGHGGWPLSVFMTTDKKPFYTGTYFPKEQRGDYPGFRSVVTSLGQAWESQRDELEKSASEFVAGLSQAISQDAGPLTPSLNLELIDQAIIKSHEDFDFENGGFGEQPKFPPHAAMKFLIEYAAKRHTLSGNEQHIDSLCEQAGHMGLMTLEEMSLGGIHDHVGGGFHRYSTDAEWRLPHFEKMLTDNALLLGMYASGANSTGDPRLKKLFTRTADSIAGWIEEEMVGDDGLFMSAMDADTEGEEGLYYTWTVQEINDMLGDRAESFIELFGFSEDGNFADEATGKPTKRNVIKLDQDDERGFEEDMRALKTVRQDRPKPMLDDKAVCSGNGLAIGSLARVDRIDLASDCATRWVAEFGKLGHLPHHITKGQASGIGFLDDYAFMANGLLDLYEVDGDKRWRNAAEKMCDKMCESFRDENGLFRSTGPDHEKLFGRMTPVLDQAVPSAVAEAARVLARLGRADESRKTILACLGWMQRMTNATQSLLLLALEDFIAHPDADRALASVDASEVTVTLEPSEITVDEEGWGHSEIVFQIPKGSHINSTEPTAKFLTPTTVRVEGVFGEAGFPTAENEEYTDELRVGLRLRPKSGTEEFQIHVRYQSCTETDCQLPQESTLAGVVIVP